MRPRTVAALTLLLAACAARPKAPALWAGLSAGRHAVGYRQEGSGEARMDVWYPASKGGTPVAWRELPGADALAESLRGAGVPAADLALLTDAPLLARRGALPEGGRFPLLLVAHGNRQDAADQAVLSELLASHGFVVASVPSPTLFTPMTSVEQVGALADRQARMLAEAAALAPQGFPADGGRIGLLAHSFGARGALLHAMREPHVAALVSLDGGSGTATGRESLALVPGFDPAKMRAPLLHFYEELDAFMKPDFALLSSLRSDGVSLVKVDGLHHHHFTTLGFAAATIPSIAKATGAAPREAEGVRDVARRTLGFFQRNVARSRAW